MQPDRHVTVEYELSHDISWFAVDTSGEIGHFTTGGQGVMPRALKGSVNDLHRVKDYINSVAIDPELESTSTKPVLYFQRDEMLGIFCYECSFEKLPTFYYRIALPKEPMHVASLPEEIRQLVKRARLDLKFRDAEIIQEFQIEKDLEN